MTKKERLKQEAQLLPTMGKHLFGLHKAMNPGGTVFTLEGVVFMAVTAIWAIITLGEAFIPTVKCPPLLSQVFSGIIGYLLRGARGKASRSVSAKTEAPEYDTILV